MSLSVPQLPAISGTTFKVGIAAACYNERLVGALLEQTVTLLKKQGVKAKAIEVVRVPGSNELPVAVKLLGKKQKPDVLIALGVIIRGDTIHYELISEAATNGLMHVALDLNIPVINGIVVAKKQSQAVERCTGKINRGAEFAFAALHMANLKKQLSK
jgi:6,7-dimethyl-8-ribityllumazine synthase